MDVRHLPLLLCLAVSACAATPTPTTTTHTTGATSVKAPRLDVSRVPDEQALDATTPVSHLRATLQYGFANAVTAQPPPPAAADMVLALDDVSPRTAMVNGVRVVTVSYRGRWLGRGGRVVAAMSGTAHARAVSANGRELADAVSAMYEQLIEGLDGALKKPASG